MLNTLLLFKLLKWAVHSVSADEEGSIDDIDPQVLLLNPDTHVQLIFLNKLQIYKGKPGYCLTFELESDVAFLSVDVDLAVLLEV